MKLQDMISLRSEHVSAKLGEALMEKMSEIYERDYIPRRTEKEYADLLLNENIGFSGFQKLHPQDSNHPDAIYKCFTYPSQWVYGFTKKHCLDQVLDAIEREAERMKLPTLSDSLLNSLNIDPNKLYRFKSSFPLAVDTYSGTELLEMIESGGVSKYFMTKNPLLSEIDKEIFKKL